MTEQLAASLISSALFLIAAAWDVFKAGNGR